MAELIDAIQYIQTLMKNVTGPSTDLTYSVTTDAPSDAIAEVPFIITYPDQGRLERMSDFYKDMHTVFTEVHISPVLMREGIAQAIDVIPKVRNELLNDPTLGGNVDTLQFPIPYKFGRLPWGGAGDSHLGVRFTVEFKMQGAVST